MKMCKALSTTHTASSIAYDIRLSPTNHLLDQTDAFDVISSSVTKLPTVLMSRNASSAATIMNTIETERVLSSVPIIVGQTWLVRRSVPVKTSYRREKRQQQKRGRGRLLQNPPSIHFLLLLSTVFKCAPNCGSSRTCSRQQTQISPGSFDRRACSTVDHYQHPQGRNRTLSENSSKLHNATGLEVRCSSSRTSCFAMHA